MTDEEILRAMYEKVGKTQTDVAVLRVQVGAIKENSQRNTSQISEIREKMIRPSLLDFGSKIWPFVIGLVVAAAAGGAAFADKLFR